jgi:hypothetical protein
MEFPGREASQSLPASSSALAANEHAPNPKEMELEMAAGGYRNGAPDGQGAGEDMLLDGGKLGALRRREFFDNLLKRVEDDNLRFLQRQKQRIDRVGVKLPAIEVTYGNLCVEAESRYSGGSHLPTLWNSIKAFLSIGEREFPLEGAQVANPSKIWFYPNPSFQILFLEDYMLHQYHVYDQ